MSDAPRLVLVVGVGRSGTSLLANVLGQLGFHIPQPEVEADESNPRGFGEPRWVVDFHGRLMRSRKVIVFDARPSAWERTREAAAAEGVHAELRDWLAGELAHGDVVIKDPRIGWFLPLWQAVAQELGVTPSFVTMLRHPAEILLSARRSYGDWQTDASRAASWLNVMLETERATREARRAYVRYPDLLGDWPGQLSRLGRELDVAPLRGLDAAAHPDIDAFVDPSLYRNGERWDELEVPPRVRELCEAVWTSLQPLADGDGDRTEAESLDAAHAAYDALYADAEAIAQTSAIAERPRPKPKPPPPPPAPPPTGLRRVRMAIARRIPARQRKRLRAALGAERRSG